MCIAGLMHTIAGALDQAIVLICSPTGKRALRPRLLWKRVVGGLDWLKQVVFGEFEDNRDMSAVVPTTDGRELTLSRYTQPEPEHRMLLDQLRLALPNQPPPKITATQARQKTADLVM
jgi:hypothetical protein